MGVRRVGVLRSVHTRFVGRGRVTQALQRSRSGSIHRTVHPSFPPCAHRIYRTQPTTHAAYSQQHFSASPCTSLSAAGCTQGGWQALVRPHEVDLREMPELSSTGHPVARDQLDQAGQDRRDQLLLLASRPVAMNGGAPKRHGARERVRMTRQRDTVSKLKEGTQHVQKALLFLSYILTQK